MSERCPVCGSSGCAIPDLPVIACPKCGPTHVIGMVRERSAEFAIVDWMCRRCGHKWSSACVLSEKFGVKSVIYSKLE